MVLHSMLSFPPDFLLNMFIRVIPGVPAAGGGPFILLPERQLGKCPSTGSSWESLIVAQPLAISDLGHDAHGTTVPDLMQLRAATPCLAQLLAHVC